MITHLSSMSMMMCEAFFHIQGVTSRDARSVGRF